MTRGWQILDISPEPTDDERDAIIAAFAVLASEAMQHCEVDQSRWRETAKIELMRTNMTGNWNQGRNARWNRDREPAILASPSDSSLPDR